MKNDRLGNKSYTRTGHLFEHPFKRIEVTTLTYAKQLMIYIHQNAQDHRFVSDFRDWSHSSYHTHLSKKQTRLRRGKVMNSFSDQSVFEASHKAFLGWHEISELAPEDFY